MSLLDDAQQLINGDRAEVYGEANSSLGEVAAIWSVLLGVKVTSKDVIRCMIGLKLIRSKKSPDHRDSWVDIAGYAGLSERVLEMGAGDGGNSTLPNE